jgi:hypothetical protein
MWLKRHLYQFLSILSMRAHKRGGMVQSVDDRWIEIRLLTESEVSLFHNIKTGSGTRAAWLSDTFLQSPFCNAGLQQNVCAGSWASTSQVEVAGKTICLVFRRQTELVIVTQISRGLPKKLTGLQLVKKFPSFYGTRRFITAFTTARHLSLSWGFGCTEGSVWFRGFCNCFVTLLRFYGWEMLSPRPTPKQEDHLLSGIQDYIRIYAFE